MSFTIRCKHGFHHAHSIVRGREWLMCSESATFTHLCYRCKGKSCLECDGTGLAVNEPLPKGWTWELIDGDWALTFKP